MQKCPHCSAPVQDLVERCTFCGSLTEYGVTAHQARVAQTDAERLAAQQQAVVDGARARAAAQVDVDTAGKWAILASALGTVLCCVFPVGPVLGIIFGLRARRLAAQHGLPAATLGTTGLTLGGLGVALAVTLWIFIGVMEVKEKQQRDALKAQLQNISAPQLDLQTACALTELELLNSRYEEFGSTNELECTTTGDLEQHGEDALLRDVHFTKAEKRVEVFSCLRYRNKWSVRQLRGDEDCNAPRPQKEKKQEQD